MTTLVIDTNIFTLTDKPDDPGWQESLDLMEWIGRERFCNYILAVDEEGLIEEEYEKKAKEGYPNSLGSFVLAKFAERDKIVHVQGRSYPCFRDLPPELDRHDRAFLKVACQTPEHILISQDSRFYENNSCLNRLKSETGLKIYRVQEAIANI
ncbi:MAG: hypothetical protein ABIM59_05185 [candidate division WOR-3 bacterium]